MADLDSLPYDQIKLNDCLIVVTTSRRAGRDATGQPYRSSLPGAFIPGKQEQDPLVHQRETALLNELHIARQGVYTGSLAGQADVAFVDALNPSELPDTKNGYHNVGKVDAIFGYQDSVKLARLGDCGLLVVQGVAENGRKFDGFVHTTRLNMRTDDQFSTVDGRTCGGVELMLRQMVEHYRPTTLHLSLVAAIAQQFYIHTFVPTPEMLDKDPQLTETSNREAHFPGWQERGWIRPHVVDGEWQQPMYEVDLWAAIRHQVAAAGLAASYDDSHVALDGDPASGHASHRAARLGLVDQTRDCYLVIPNTYSSNAGSE